jgi:hypothetical protein
MESFIKALRAKLRFAVANVGTVSVEQLWDVSMSNLISYEEDLKKQVDSFGTSSRRNARAKNAEQETAKLRLEIVKYILDTRETEIDAAANEAEVKAHNQKILALISAKKEEELTKLSTEELEKLLKV